MDCALQLVLREAVIAEDMFLRLVRLRGVDLPAA